MRPRVRLSLRTKIALAILGAVLLTDALATWAVGDRVLVGARDEADRQAQARLAQIQALYTERSATLAAEAEAISLYPAVTAAVADRLPGPLLQWASQVTARQGTSVTVTDASGRVVARGHAPDQSGDDLAPRLAGVRLALIGQPSTGTEEGDELGLALRGYAPVRQNGQVVGAVMIADRFNDQLLGRLLGREAATAELRLAADPGATDPGRADGCEAPVRASARCHLSLVSTTGQPVAELRLEVSLDQVEQARASAQQAVWIGGALVLVPGGLAAWLLARSLTRPLARLTRAADHIAGGAYDQPVTVEAASAEIGLLAQAFEAMRAQVARTTGALRGERDVLDAVLESTGDGILMVDARGASVVSNGRWSEILGGDGLAAAATLRRSESGELFTTLASAWLVDPERVALVDLDSREPAPRRLRCYSAPVRHRDGTPLGRIFVVRDVTRESEAERMRSALVSTVSHELRSPLAAITGYTRTLLDGGPWDTRTQQEFLEIVATSAEKLASLVDNLLDAAKLEAGVLSLEPEPVRVERIAQRVLDQRRHLTTSHDLRLAVEPDLPLVSADPLRLEQVLVNLVDNAIKYSPGGGPIGVSVVRSPRGVLVGVSDRGVGIEAAQAERLFERFYRVDNALARETKGVGLGLYITRSLVRAHGGDVWVESEPGQGSTFWFELPRLVDEPAGSVAPAPASRAGALHA